MMTINLAKGYQTSCTGDLFVVVKVCIEPDTLFGWADHICATESLKDIDRFFSCEDILSLCHRGIILKDQSKIEKV